MWQDIVTKVVIWIVGAIITGVGAFVMNLIRTKIKNEKAQKILTGALNLIYDGVDYTYQTYVEAIKGTNLWDKEAQEKALNDTVAYVKNQLAPKSIEFITENYGDVEQWVKGQIEVAIKKSKNK